ncbi:hypothetical protein [Saccharothrix sp. NRRL B-16348]|uniref:hypothetical protein n=1 Tax=Saccharothrix sp. NRRL B-16348 TaxID=1415542 RepID=UPI002F3E4F8C
MAAGVEDRSGTVATALGYADAGGIRVFTGTLQGVLTTERRGDGGSGATPSVVQAGSELTFAGMRARSWSGPTPNRTGRKEVSWSSTRRGITEIRRIRVGWTEIFFTGGGPPGGRVLVTTGPRRNSTLFRMKQNGYDLRLNLSVSSTDSGRRPCPRCCFACGGRTIRSTGVIPPRPSSRSISGWAAPPR